MASLEDQLKALSPEQREQLREALGEHVVEISRILSVTSKALTEFADSVNEAMKAVSDYPDPL